MPEAQLEAMLWVLLIFAGAFGACVGSFLNVVIYRLPAGESLITPPSHCPSCNTRLAATDNIPILSWLVLGAKCRYCKVPISPQYVAIEALTAALWAGVFYVLFFTPMAPQFSEANSLWGAVVGAAPILLLVSCLVAGTVIDARHLIIPSGITWLAAAFGLIYPLAALKWDQTMPLVSPTAPAWASTATLGGCIGLAIAIGLLYLGVLPLSFGDEEEVLAEVKRQQAEQNEGEAKGDAACERGDDESADEFSVDSPGDNAGASAEGDVNADVNADVDADADAKTDADIQAAARQVDSPDALVLTGDAAAGDVSSDLSGAATDGVATKPDEVATSAGESAAGAAGAAETGDDDSHVAGDRAGEGVGDEEEAGDANVWSRETAEEYLNYPYARREMFKELLFLAFPAVGAVLAYLLLPKEPNLLPWVDVLVGVTFGYLFGGGLVWGTRILGTLGFGSEAMGLGDVHLLAAIGAVLGWQSTIATFFGAAMLGVFYAVFALVARSTGGKLRILPFGPFLAGAAVIFIFFKTPVTNYIDQALGVFANMPF